MFPFKLNKFNKFIFRGRLSLQAVIRAVKNKVNIAHTSSNLIILMKYFRYHLSKFMDYFIF